jgi:hypothetical protein
MNQDKEVQISPAELRVAAEADVAKLMQEISDAMNKARDGAIIADSEGPVREALARFRQKLYETAAQLKADKAAKAAFSPSAQRQGPAAQGQGRPRRQPPDGQRDDSH